MRPGCKRGRLCDRDANAAAYTIQMQYKVTAYATRMQTWPSNTEFKVTAYASEMQTRLPIRPGCKRDRLCDRDANAAANTIGMQYKVTAYATGMQTRPPLRPGCKCG